MQINKNKLLMMAVILLEMALTVAAVFTLNALLIVAALCALLLLFFFYKMGYIIEDFLFVRTGIVEVIGPYELSGSRNSAFRRLGSGFSCIAVALLEVNNHDEVDRKKIENIIAHSGHAFRFVMQARRQDISGITDGLRTGISSREIRLARLGNSKKDTQTGERIRREIEVMRNDLRSMEQGEAPMELMYYLCASAESESAYAAEESAISHIRELSSQFDALLGSRSRILSGSELADVISLDVTMKR